MWTRTSKPFLLMTASALTYGVAIKDSSEVPETKTKWSSVEEKKNKARSIIKRHMVVNGIPGMSVGVSVDGTMVWSEGFGYANVETGTTCTSDTVMRIASISKPITATIAAKLVQEKKLDLDRPIQDYVTDFPHKKFNGKEHHSLNPQNIHVIYSKEYLILKQTYIFIYLCLMEDLYNFTLICSFITSPHAGAPTIPVPTEGSFLSSDPTLRGFSYTTHGLTLVSAVLEKASGKQFPKLVQDLCSQLGMRNTSLDVNKNIIPNRTSYYYRNRNHVLENCQEVDNSYKWAGGGLLSNVEDLLIFANAILFSHQASSNTLLSQDVLSEFWKGEIQINETTLSALGWMRVDGNAVGGLQRTRPVGAFWYHTGAAVGASSVLLIQPCLHQNPSFPRGVCVAMPSLSSSESCDVLQFYYLPCYGVILGRILNALLRLSTPIRGIHLCYKCSIVTNLSVYTYIYIYIYIIDAKYKVRKQFFFRVFASHKINVFIMNASAKKNAKKMTKRPSEDGLEELLPNKATCLRALSAEVLNHKNMNNLNSLVFLFLFLLGITPSKRAFKKKVSWSRFDYFNLSGHIFVLPRRFACVEIIKAGPSKIIWQVTYISCNGFVFSGHLFLIIPTVSAADLKTEENVVIRKASIRDASQCVREYWNLSMCRLLSHPNIMSTIDAFEAEGDLYTVTEFMDGRLTDIIDEHLNHFVIARIIYQLLSALQQLHSNDLYHGNITLNSVYVNTDATLKLSSYGEITEMKPSDDKFKGHLWSIIL
uniref:Protein kinase domain-containing protein n=1 Tax=Heterorhabditis bacteriophora TaxID=37862 RepID=A0A1I7X2U8_HETBA